MNEIIAHIPVLVAGIALGVFYWGGLWWTCQRIMDGRAHPALMGLSYFVRLGVAVGAMYLLGQGSMIRLVLIVVGMLGVRIAMSRSLSAAGPSTGACGAKESCDHGHHS